MLEKKVLVDLLRQFEFENSLISSKYYLSQNPSDEIVMWDVVWFDLFNVWIRVKVLVRCQFEKSSVT